MAFFRSALAQSTAGPRASLSASSIRIASSSSRTLVSPVASVRYLSSTAPRRDLKEEKDPQLGDYPDLPHVSYQLRPYSKKWWDKQERRNFGEPVPEQWDALSFWSPDVHPRFNQRRAFGSLAVFFTTVVGLYFTLGIIGPKADYIPRTYARDGLQEEYGNGKVFKAYSVEDVEREDSEEEEEEDDDE